MTRRQFLALIVPLIVLLIGFIVLFAVERSGPPGAPPWDADFARFVRERMSQEFVWGTGGDDEGWEAYFAALNAYIQHYDVYAEVVPPWEVEQSRENSSGQYPGIGIRIEAPPPPAGQPLASVKIIGVKPKGPADEAGIRVGDVIVGIGDRTVAELCPAGDDAPLKDAIRGPSGTKVGLTLRGPDGAERRVDVGRARIDHGTVVGARILPGPGRLGYVRIRSFQASTAADLARELENLQKDGGLGALVLDLRQNPGGLLDQALAVADLFLESGVIMRQRGRSGAYTETYEATEKKTFSATLPLAVLVDHGSASASEVLAGALQDHGRAAIVGQRSWGKFLVQIVEAVPMERGVALFKRTTSIYETPLGHHYQRRSRGNGPDPLAGIQPDLDVPLGNGDHAKLASVFRYEVFAEWNPAEEHPAPDFVDPQLAAAIATLKGEMYYPLIRGPKRALR